MTDPRDTNTWRLHHAVRLFCCVLLAACALLPALAAAGGQVRLFDAKEAIRGSFWKEVYFAGGEALWCKTKFVEPGARVTADAMYQVPWIKDAVGCSTREQCESNKEFQRMTADLHNYFPAEKRVQLDRRNILFDKVATSDPLPEPTCVYKMFGGQMEPNNEIKGEVARAILYMHAEYDLKVPGPINMFIDWNNADAPSAEEKRRNEMIEKIQGTRNRFVDNPRSAEKLRAR